MIDRTSFAPFVFVEHDDPPVRDCGGRSRPRYGLLLHGVDMERAVATLARAGVPCDGDGWNDLAERLARRELPDEVDLLTFDSDAETFAVTGDRSEPLRALGKQLGAAYRDLLRTPTRLRSRDRY
ncbi:Imm51 family immunity protein [Micromonospora sp. NPDC049799]|uniref:Imm51 family immunity protein n=1 Tax=Micromonospora sp. NPDC049799 TaxID=3154741 RepID=UPI0033F0D958